MEGIEVADGEMHTEGTAETGSASDEQRLPEYEIDAGFPRDKQHDNTARKQAASEARAVVGDEWEQTRIECVERGGVETEIM